MSSATSKWVKFFKDAGLPSTVSTKYAVVFTDHRIQNDMLKDINKEILYDMGIKTMGDVIAILRHAKYVHDEDTQLKLLGNDDKQPVSSLPPKPATTVDAPSHQLPIKQRISVNTSNSGTTERLGNRLSTPVKPINLPLKRQADQVDYGQVETKVRCVLPRDRSSLPIEKQNILSLNTSGIRVQTGVGKSVFKRLGAETSTTTSISTPSSVFKRLGPSESPQPSNVRLVASLSNHNSNSGRSVLRGTSESFSGYSPAGPSFKATATVKPTNVLIRKSLADATTTTIGSNTVFKTTKSNIRGRLGSPAMTKSPKTISLKKSIFDRLGPL